MDLIGQILMRGGERGLQAVERSHEELAVLVERRVMLVIGLYSAAENRLPDQRYRRSRSFVVAASRLRKSIQSCEHSSIHLEDSLLV